MWYADLVEHKNIFYEISFLSVEGLSLGGGGETLPIIARLHDRGRSFDLMALEFRR